MIRVKHPEGYIASIEMPDGCKPVIAVPGATILGTSYFKETLLTVSDTFADHLVTQGKARHAEEVA